MTKLTRQKLVKGTKLAAQQVNDFNLDAITNVNDAALKQDENFDYKSTFRLNWSVNRWLIVNPDYDAYTGTDRIASDELFQGWNFILPNPQELFDENTTPDSKFYELNEVHLSLDQCDEPAALVVNRVRAAGPDYAPAVELSADNVVVYEFEIEIFKKNPSTLGGTSSTAVWDERIFKTSVPSTAFSAAGTNFNPFIIKDLNIQLSPDLVYLAMVRWVGTPPKVEDTPSRTADAADVNYDTVLINNLQLGLVCKAPLMTRDTSGESDIDEDPDIQNMPFIYRTPADQPGTLTNQVIVPDDTINAGPIMGNLEKVDDFALRKFSGGATTFGDPVAKETADFMAYEVLPVQIFSNNCANYSPQVEAGFRYAGNYFPYSEEDVTPNVLLNAAGPVFFDQVGDRKVVTLHEPFIIHHMFLGYPTGINDTTALVNHRLEYPDAANLRLEIEVVLWTPERADTYKRQTIGYLEPFQPVATTTASGLIDQACDTEKQFHTPAGGGDALTSQIRWQLRQIPINCGATSAQQGKGYRIQGKPFYVGRGRGNETAFNASRTRVWNMYNTAGQLINPNTNGGEKFIEIVAKYSTSDAGHLATNDIAAVGSTNTQMKIAQPGMCVYLVGKKYIMGSGVK